MYFESKPLPFFVREHLRLLYRVGVSEQEKALFGAHARPSQHGITPVYISIDAMHNERKNPLVETLINESRRIQQRLVDATSLPWECYQCDRWIRAPIDIDMDRGYWHEAWRWALPMRYPYFDPKTAHQTVSAAAPPIDYWPRA